MSLHLGSSKYDEHTVRKGISNRHFDHRVNKGTLSISIPRALSASRITMKCINCHASLRDEAMSSCPSIHMAPYSRGSFPSLSLVRRCHPAGSAPLPQHPPWALSCSPWESRGVPLGTRSARGRGCYLLRVGKGARLVLIASAGKASKAGSEVSVASQEQSAARPRARL